ncbi:ABC transporter permease [Cohnella sp. REN36]|uniref:ABC transporter permease n=1 Tax=Cohnella sp. REN36 TaxID=2887347 RepID=UPI001D145113|nr:ABC transporter permease [Cohnella sp. REN36]MCC3373709.1 ABC transporter permease [Cohnella sp. REN36]
MKLRAERRTRYDASSDLFRWIRQRKALTLSGAIVLVFTILAAIAPLLVAAGSNDVALTAKLEGPSWQYPLGTDHLGRSVISRLMLGASTSLSAAYAVLGMSLAIGVLAGSVAGWMMGWADTAIMRLCDLFLAVPSLVLGLALIGIFGRSPMVIIGSMVMAFWAPYAKLVRGLVLQLKDKTYMQAAKLSGTRGSKLLTRHLLPNFGPELLVAASLDVGAVILFLSGLSFLGLGFESPAVEWGAMVNDSRPYWTGHPSLMVYPSLMIMATVIAFNRLGESLRDELDPKFDPIRKSGSVRSAFRKEGVIRGERL